MKIQCNVCLSAEATVLCCADEAALCWACDEKVHAANKLASKHQRVPLSSPNSQMPKCDICQETVGYFFCLEDRALLCRKCDVAIHTVSTLASSHQRFLLTGVKVGLEAANPGEPPTTRKSPSCEKITEAEEPLAPPRAAPMSPSGRCQTAGDFVPPRLPPFAGGSSVEGIQQWQFDEFLGLADFDQSYNFIDNGSSKADGGKATGDLGCSPILRALEVELDSEDCLGQVPDSNWAVPQMSNPPTASGLYWPEQHHRHSHGRQQRSDTAPAAFVPDVCYSTMPNFYDLQQTTSSPKRIRRY